MHSRPTPPLPGAMRAIVPDLAQAIRAKVAARAPKATAASAATGAADGSPRSSRSHASVAPAWPAAPQARGCSSAAGGRGADLPVQRRGSMPESERRERLKERLKAVRENPRPEPLPETVAEAGVLAVERISALQTELVKVRTLNLALTQDLEATRRQAERATEEARLRMDEARRLSSEMEGRAKLLNDLERELGALEGERNERCSRFRNPRQQLDAREHEEDELKAEIGKHQQALVESLSEEEVSSGAGPARGLF